MRLPELIVVAALVAFHVVAAEHYEDEVLQADDVDLESMRDSTGPAITSWTVPSAACPRPR